MSGGITKRGDIGLRKAIDEYEKRFIREIKRIVAETTEIVVGQAKALAPVGDMDGGNLKKFIEANYMKRGLSAFIIVGAHYGIYVEYGTGIYAVEGNGRKTPWVYYSEKLGRWVYTRGMAAQPYWNPALEAGAKHFQSEMNKLGA